MLWWDICQTWTSCITSQTKRFWVYKLNVPLYVYASVYQSCFLQTVSLFVIVVFQHVVSYIWIIQIHEVKYLTTWEYYKSFMCEGPCTRQHRLVNPLTVPYSRSLWKALGLSSSLIMSGQIPQWHLLLKQTNSNKRPCLSMIHIITFQLQRNPPLHHSGAYTSPFTFTSP